MGTGPIHLAPMPMGWMSGASPPQSTLGTPGHQRVLSHTQKVQAELPSPVLSHGLLYVTKAPAWHQDDPEMRALFPLLNCFGVPWSDKASSNSKCFCASCTSKILENMLWKVFLSESSKNLNSLFFFARFKATSKHGLKGWTSVSELTVFFLPHHTSPVV